MPELEADVGDRLPVAPGPSRRSSHSLVPRAAQNSSTCNASYALARRGRCSGTSMSLAEDEVGELKLPAYQLLLIRSARHPFDCCAVCGD